MRRTISAKLNLIYQRLRTVIVFFDLRLKTKEKGTLNLQIVICKCTIVRIAYLRLLVCFSFLVYWCVSNTFTHLLPIVQGSSGGSGQLAPMTRQLAHSSGQLTSSEDKSPLGKDNQPSPYCIILIIDKTSLYDYQLAR